MNYLKHFSLSALSVIALLVFIIINPGTGFDLLAFLLIVFIILQKIFGEYFILILLAMRPALDYWRDLNLFSFNLFDFNINAALSVFLLAWSIIFFLKNHEYFADIPLKAPFLALILWCGISAFYTYNLSSTITETIKLANLFALFGICYIMAKKDGAKFKDFFLKSAILAATIPITVGIYQFISKTGADIDELSNRIYGTFAHPNVLATFALVLLFIVINEIASRHKKTENIFDFNNDAPLKISALFLSFIILLTYTRIAWVGTAMLFAIVGLIYYRKIIIYALAGIALFYALFYPVNNYLINNHNVNLQASHFIFRLTARNQDSDSIRWRTNLITKVLPLFKEKYLYGYGYGTFARVWDDNKDIENLWDNTSEAHNDYIKVAFESGIIGLVLFLLIFVSLLYRQILLGVKNHWANIVFIASIFAYLVMSMSDNMLHHTPVIWWLWAVWGWWTAGTKPLNSRS